MESASGQPARPPAEELAQLEQAAAVAAIAPMPVPTWVWPVVAVIGSVFAAGYVIGDIYQIVLPAVAGFAMLRVAMTVAQSHGVVNNLRTQPRRLTMLQLYLAVQVLILAVAMFLVATRVNRWLAVALAGPIFAVLFYLHDERYEATTAKMRAAQCL